PLCVYWDFKALNGSGNWSTAGCRFNRTEKLTYICHCQHLTNFAILTNHLALSVLSIVGLVLSISALSFVILSFISFRHAISGRSQKVLVNLAAALLLVNVTFLAGVNRTSDYTGCVLVAALLHYFLLVSFSWMLIEGTLQYLRFVKVLDTYIENFMLKVTIPGWS
ncbi:hypothetical protein CAPTEDRAFT_122466, partial [Capitella teleta]